MTKRNTSSSYSHPSLKGIEYVLFPHDRYVQYWDDFFLCVLLYYCFAIPYTVGISGGYWMYTNKGWFIFNIVLNVVYIADTCMQFFRAYYDGNGVIVYELRRIAKHYVISGQFFLNLLASFPMQVIMIALNRKYEQEGEEGPVEFESRDLNLLVIAQLCRLLRIPRVNVLIKSSIAFQTWWERQDVARAMLASFILKLIVVAHWIACFWSFIAFIQVWTFGDALGEEANWISNWYELSYVKGGIDPIGWQNDIDRYALSLFWSIQSLTSIGYGNIFPTTRLEYFSANILMIASGLFWAFTIGNIVTIIEHMHSRRNQYKKQLDETNTLIGSFSRTSAGTANEQSDIGVGDPSAVATRIRKFVTSRYDRTNRPAAFNSPNLDEIFPALQGYSLELRKLASLHIMRKYFEMVPYLSSTYLSTDEQSDLAFNCIFLEFSRGEIIEQHPKYGRGIIIPRRGMVLCTHAVHGTVSLQIFGIDDPIAVNEVLVEDSFLENERPIYRSVPYSVVVFIPQSAIYEVLEAKKSAWKNCARWKYLQACFLKWAREEKRASSTMQMTPQWEPSRH